MLLSLRANSKSDILRIPATAERFRPTPDQIKQWKAEDTAEKNTDVDPKTRERLTKLGLMSGRIDGLMLTLASETEKLREQINDPTQTSSTEYQDYRRLLQADAQIRDAVLWIKDGDKMRQVEVGLGLSDGSFVEVMSGLAEGDAIVTGIGSPSGARRGPPGGRAG